jgi:hypothetical protein
MYTFIKVFCKTNLLILKKKDKSIDVFSHFKTQQLKNYSWFIFLLFDWNLIQNDLFYGYEESTMKIYFMKKLIRHSFGIQNHNYISYFLNEGSVYVCLKKICTCTKPKAQRKTFL